VQEKESNHLLYTGEGTLFQLGEQKVGENNQDNQTQNITLCSMYFSKKYGVQRGLGQSPQKLFIYYNGSSLEFCVKRNRGHRLGRLK